MSKRKLLTEGVRSVTEEEVSFYHEHGWVKLDQLVTADLAEKMLRIGIEQLARLAPDQPICGGLARTHRLEPFVSLVFGAQMGINASRLINRQRLTDVEVPVIYRVDMLGKREPGNGYPTPYHQDSAEHGSDRVGELQFWLALAEVTPEMGAMRFVSGVHREGPLGAGAVNGDPDILNVYPKLLDHYELSPPFHYMPGDATVHHGHMVHGAPANTGTETRWNYLFSYTTADTRYFNGSAGNHGSERRPLDQTLHPVVYPP
jgi:hypothetical protein